MSVWTLVLRESVSGRVDASSIRLADWKELSPGDVERRELKVGRHIVCLADLFTVKLRSTEGLQLVIEGDLHNFDRLGDRHDAGRFHVTGSVGNHAGGSMSGGRLSITGDAGDHLAAPHGAARQGMRGGRITIGGSAGNYVGHRMRRGEVFIDGDAGRFTASQMIAGTIMVAGKVGDDTATGMRRGTVIATRLPKLPEGRFSTPVVIRSVFPNLIDTSCREADCDVGPLSRLGQLIDQISSDGFASRRGDRAVAGKGEVLAPFSLDMPVSS